MWCFRAGMDSDAADEGLLCTVPLIVVPGSWKLTLREIEAVFLELLRP